MLAYASHGRLPKLIVLVKGFASRRPETTVGQLDQLLGPASTQQRLAPKSPGPIEYPKHVSKQFYQVLCRHSKCLCAQRQLDDPTSTVTKEGHMSRLRLKPSREVREKVISFDMVFSSRPASFSPLNVIDWQHMQFQVSR